MDLAFGLHDEHSDATFSVTVIVNGQAIGGQAIPFEEWAVGTKAMLAEAGAGNLADGLGIVVDKIKEAEEHNAAEAEANDKLIYPGRKYLHLKEVRGTGPLAGHKWVRIRLDSIDAWTFGVRS